MNHSEPGFRMPRAPRLGAVFLGVLSIASPLGVCRAQADGSGQKEKLKSGSSVISVTTGSSVTSSTGSDGKVNVTISTTGPDGKTVTQTFPADPAVPAAPAVPQPPAAPEVRPQAPPPEFPGTHRLQKVSFLGVSVVEAPPVLGKHLAMLKGAGLVVFNVSKDSPAQKAGVVEDDVLLRLGDQILVNPAQLRTLVQARKPGQKISLSLLREGKELTIEVELSEQNEAQPDPHAGMHGAPDAKAPPFFRGGDWTQSGPLEPFSGVREKLDQLRRRLENRGDEAPGLRELEERVRSLEKMMRQPERHRGPEGPPENRGPDGSGPRDKGGRPLGGGARSAERPLDGRPEPPPQR